MPAGSRPGKEVTEDGLAEVQGNPVTTLPPPPQTVACNDEAVHESGTESDESILSGMPDSGDASTAMHHVKNDTHACPDSGLGKVLSGKSLLESRHAKDELDAVSRGLRVGTVAGGASPCMGRELPIPPIYVCLVRLSVISCFVGFYVMGKCSFVHAVLAG